MTERPPSPPSPDLPSGIESNATGSESESESGSGSESESEPDTDDETASDGPRARPDHDSDSDSESASASAPDPIVLTTPQLATAIESWLGHSPDDDLLESLLLALDRRDLLECEGLTRDGEYRWNLTDTPEQIGDAIAEVVIDVLR
ncbi:hypothetical protein [Halobiforma nitratireducens]|uniref:Uncharacterized protein n=1 Tax=Halobiforma nitratireducens JCM 10879 TaxID=1227454 RepID=M0MJL5_9EURY|nr:hypothetical protein [Halobiforma nitratireducens]EMA45538.1 hypothetical protein C446_02175 [Halobiforma nitratireducens JCM 10879]